MPLLKQWYPVQNNFNEATDIYRKAIVPTLPAEYIAGLKQIQSNLPFNGVGWNPMTGKVEQVVIFYIVSPSKPITLSLLAKGFKTPGDLSRYASSIEAKVGTEMLVRKSIVLNGNSITLTFDPPAIHAYQKGIQNIFVHFPRLFSDASGNPSMMLKRLDN